MHDSSATLDKTMNPKSDLAELAPPPHLRKPEVVAHAPAAKVKQGAAASGKRGSMKRVLLIVVGLVAVTGGIRYGWHWWTVGRFEETTDDAFLQADKVTVAPKVGGFVADVFVTDNQPVKAGDMIARIDDRDYQVVLAQDEADLEKSK